MPKFGSVVAIAVFVLFASAQASASAFSCTNVFRKAWFDEISFDETENSLLNQSIESAVSVNDYLRSQGKVVSQSTGTSPAFVVTLKDGTKGVFKPLGEKNTREVVNGEAAAYRVSKLLGLRVVPPTVLRKFGSEAGELSNSFGSFQFFVETKIDVLRENNDNSLSKITDTEWNQANLVHFLIGQWDRHTGNFLIDNNGRLVVIDNGAMNAKTQWRLGDYPWVARGTEVPELAVTDQPFPFDSPSGVLKNPNRKMVGERLGHVLGRYQQELVATKLKHQTPDKTFTYTFWNRKLYAQRFGKLKKLSISFLSEKTQERIQNLKMEEVAEELRGLVNSDKLSEIETRLGEVRAKFPKR